MHIPSGKQYSFYYSIQDNVGPSIVTRSDGSIYNLHGLVINKLCSCGQGVEVRAHATEAKLEGQEQDFQPTILTKP